MRLPALILVLFAAAAPASLPDVEDEVMCVECGTALNISQSAVADQERALIRREIARGRDKEEIKATLVREYGPGVLALPDDGGFNLAVYLVPALLALAAAGGLALAARRWRRGARAPSAAPGPELDAAEQRRLDAELAAFDR